TLHTTQTLDTSGKPDEEEELLDEIIQRINERVGGDFTESDRVIMETLYKRTYRGENGAKLRKYAKHNDPEMFIRSIFPNIFEKTAQDCYVELGDSFVKLFEDKDFYKLVMEEVGQVLYSAFKEEA